LKKFQELRSTTGRCVTDEWHMDSNPYTSNLRADNIDIQQPFYPSPHFTKSSIWEYNNSVSIV